MDYVLSQLPSGLRVLTVPMEDRQSSGVAVWANVGSRYETLKESGISHVIEHMLFKGTKKRSTRQIKEEIEGVGGMLNAFTSDDTTCYFAKLLHQHIPTALNVFADMVQSPALSEADFRKEKTVIIEEIKMYKDLPSHQVQEMMGEMLWPNQPLGRSVAGTPESVDKLSRRQLLDYMKRFYHPENMLVAVSGSVAHKDVVRWVDKSFHSRGLKKGRIKTKYRPARVKQAKAQVRILEKKTEQANLVIGVHGLSRDHPERYTLGILNTILGVNMSSRLFEEVREKRGLAYDIRSSASFFHDTGAVTISAGTETRKVPKAIEVILRELGKFRKTPVKAGELRRAKDYFMSQIHMGIEDTLDHLLWVGDRALDRGKLPNIERIGKKIEAVTSNDIMNLSKALFRTSRLNLAVIGPISVADQKKIRREFKLKMR